MEDYKNFLLDDGLSGSTVKQAWTATKRWFEDHRIYIQKKLRDVEAARTYFDHIPTPQQLNSILEFSNAKHRVAFSLMAFAGMRPSDVCALRLASFMIKRNWMNEDVLTIRVKQRKTGNLYATFLGPQGKKYLQQLLDMRESEGERLTKSSLIVEHHGAGSSPRSLRMMFAYVKKRTTGMNPSGDPMRKFRVYSMRKYFKLQSTRRGILTDSESEYLMGHLAGIKSLQAIYSGLSDMHDEAIEALKERYKQVLPDLETEFSEFAMHEIQARQKNMVDADTVDQLIDKAINAKLKEFDYDGKMALIQKRNQEIQSRNQELKKLLAKLKKEKKG